MQVDWPLGIKISDTPVRRVHTRSRRRNTQIVYCTKPLGMRVSESSIEERFIIVAQLDTTVKLVRAQPCRLRVPIGGRMSLRVPDFAVLTAAGAEIHETKHEDDYADPGLRSELVEIGKEVERHEGWRYSVTLNSMLLQEPLRGNTDMLWRCLADATSVDLRMRTRELLEEIPRPAADIIEATRRGDVRACDSGSWENLLSMICDGVVDYDPTLPLTENSMIWTDKSGPPRQRILPFASPQLSLPATAGAPVAVYMGLRMRAAA